MPDKPPELAYESVLDLVGRTLIVAGQTTEGAFLVPLVLAGVSTPSIDHGFTAFTADLVGPVNTRLTRPGRYLTRDGDRLFSLTLSWVTRQFDVVHYRATFVHRITDVCLAFDGAAGARGSRGLRRRGSPGHGTVAQAELDLSARAGTAVARGSDPGSGGSWPVPPLREICRGNLRESL